MDRKQLVDEIVKLSGIRSIAYEGAYRKGVIAFIEGKGLDACPYREPPGMVTFAHAFARVWRKGWNKAYEIWKQTQESAP